MSTETRMRVIGLWKLHFSLKDVQAKLKDEVIRVSKKSLCLLIKKYQCCWQEIPANLSTVSSTGIWTIAWQRTKKSLPDNSTENYSNNFQLLEHPLALSREREENLVGPEKEPDTVPWLQRQTRRNDWSGVKRESRRMISSLVKSSSQTNAPSNLSHTKVCYQKQNEPAPLAKASTKNKCVGRYICKRGYFSCSKKWAPIAFDLPINFATWNGMGICP